MSSPDSDNTQTSELTTTDFEALARFLMGPFLDKPEELKFHVEKLAGGKRLWLRAAFNDEEDNGRVFGRGGRNIKAMRNVMMAAAKQSDITVNLNVFGEPEPERSERSDRRYHCDRSRGRSGGRDRGGDRSTPARPSTNPAPPKKKPKPE
ncbi:MAG: RNA-binding protein [Leptolyngbya foveolarum]|uniref:RNA-binding protein n=1 Tax=Leptolyngbya foveolarum TaxID=47253 RepID=A0A2W4VGC6_9CYAN|nr:MAG: RNA-binding protein [Leptolyngbya foveolarum]